MQTTQQRQMADLKSVFSLNCVLLGSPRFLQTSSYEPDVIFMLINIFLVFYSPHHIPQVEATDHCKRELRCFCPYFDEAPVNL